MKKLITILLVLTVLVSCCGFLGVRSFAVVGVDDAIVGTAIGVMYSMAGGAAANISGQIANGYGTDLTGDNLLTLDKLATRGIGENGAIKIMKKTETDPYQFVPAEDLTTSEATVIQNVCNSLNNEINVQEFIDYYTANATLTDQGNFIINSHMYELKKTDLINSISNGILQGIIGGELVEKPYQFSWAEGGVPGKLSTYSRYQESLLNNYHFSEPITIKGIYAGQNYTFESADGNIYLYGDKCNIYKRGENEYTISNILTEKKGCRYGVYYIYNGKMYYYSYGGDTNNLTKVSGFSSQHAYSYIKFAKSSTGETLEEALLNAGYSDPHSALIGCKVGTYYNDVEYEDQITDNITPADLTTTVGGGVIEAPTSDEEGTILQAIEAGLLPAEFDLGLDELGNIVSANGVKLETLAGLLKQLVDGQYNFEDMESALATITMLLQKSNTNTGEMDKILQSIRSSMIDAATLNTAIAGVKELQEAQSEILERIEAHTKAIADAIAIELTLPQEKQTKLDTPDVITNKFPFSLPWDFYNILTLICADPQEPIFVVPIKTTIKNGGLNYEIDEEITLDLTVFRINDVDIVRAIMNSSSIIFAVVCLISMTRKLIWK